MKRYRSMWFVVLLLFGMAIAMQFRTVMMNATDEGESARVLALRLEEEQEKGRQLREQVAMLESEYGSQLRQIGESRGDEEFSNLFQARNHALFRAGLTAVKGSGIVMILNDAAVPGSMSIEEYIIHDSDIMPLLNELRMAGAEAISINGERVLGTTKTICAGPTILINRSRYPVPFEFKAIGDSQRLFNAMDNSETVNLLRLYDIRVELRIEPELHINRYSIFDSMESLMSGLEVVVQ